MAAISVWFIKKCIFYYAVMTFNETYQLLINISIFIIGLIIGRLSMAIQYALMKDFGKGKSSL